MSRHPEAKPKDPPIFGTGGAGRSFAEAQDDEGSAFQQNGVIKIERAVDAKLIATFARNIEETLGAHDYQNPQNMRCRYSLNPITGESILDALDPVVDLSKLAQQITQSEKIISTLAEIYNEPPVLFKDKYILRQAGVAGYPPHQDFISWPFFPKSFVTALVAVDPITEDNGCLKFYQGSHRLGLLTPADGDFHNISRSELEGCPAVSFAMQPGDALIFNALVVHESFANTSTQARRSLYLSYNAVSDGGDQRESHYRYFHSWLRKRFSEYGSERLFFK